MKENKKGYTLMIDALIALIFMLFIITTIYSMSFSRNAKTDIMSFKELHYKSEDVLDVLNKKGVLDNVSTSWADNSTPGSDEMEAAENLAIYYLNRTLPLGVGYNLTIEEGSLTSTIAVSDSSRPSLEDSSTATHSTRILVGYGSGMPTYSFVSRASLNSISNTAGSEYAYFGGFVGQGNITRFITLPDDAVPEDGYMELDAGSDFNLLVNGVQCGGTYTGVGLALAANSWPLPGSCFSAGENNLTIKFTTSNNNFIGGGYIRINYRSDDWRRMPDFQKYWFPGIKGLINLYSGFYVPSTIQRMIIHLKYRNDVKISPGVGANMFLNIAGVEVYRSNTLGDVTLDLDTNNPGPEIADKFGGWAPFMAAVSSKTVPVRFGTETFTMSTTESSTADAILITDVSGSMAYSATIPTPCNTQIPGDSSLYDCVDSGVYYRNKINVSKEADKLFVTKALDYSGMRIGLVRYSTNVVNPSTDLTKDEDALNNTINTYASTGGFTCICCGINKARTMLQSPYVAVQKSIPISATGWKMRSLNCGGNKCDPTTENSGPCFVSGWYGPSEPALFANVATPNEITGNPSRNLMRYYRKNFTVEYPPSGDGTLSIDHTGGVECYLNSNPIFGYNDPSCAAATSWENKWNVPKSYFLLGQNVLACRVRSNNAGPLRFDANLTYPRNKAMLVMSDGLANRYCRDATVTGRYTNFNSQGGVSNVPMAIGDAINSSCDAREKYNITIYSVGFGSDADEDTLKKIACWNCTTSSWIPGCSRYYTSNDADDLKGIYEDIAKTIGETSMEDQSIVVSGGSVSMGNVLDPSSYIQFNVSVPPMLGYGETMLPLESAPLSSSGMGSFNIPVGAEALDVKVTSYSGLYWTKMLKVNSTATSGWETVYDLTSDFGSDYTMLGDPYFVNVPVNKVASGTNFVNLTAGSPDTNVGASTSDKVLYKVAIKALTAYGTPKRLSDGCNWTVQFFDNTKANLTAPYGYMGLRHCNYTSSSIAYDKNSSVDEAVYMLFKQLDSNNDGRLDSKFDPDDIYIETTTVGGVRSLWGPIRVKLTLWM